MYRVPATLFPLAGRKILAPRRIRTTAIYAATIATNAENAMDARALLNELRGAATPVFRPV